MAQPEHPIFNLELNETTVVLEDFTEVFASLDDSIGSSNASSMADTDSDKLFLTQQKPFDHAVIKTEPVWPDGLPLGKSTKNAPPTDKSNFKQPELTAEEQRLLENSGCQTRNRRRHSNPSPNPSPNRALSKSAFDDIHVQ